MFVRRILSALCLASCWGGSLFLATPVRAADQPLAAAIKGLESDEAPIRRKAIDAIAHSKDMRMIDFLKAFNEGSIYYWKNGDRLVYCAEPTTDAKGDKQAPLSDAITEQPLLASGKPLVVPFDQLTDISPSGLEHRQIVDAITSLELWDPDYEQRLEAVEKAGNSGNAALIPTLEEVASDSTAQEKIRRIARESIDVLRIQGADTKPADRIAAARELGQMRSARGGAILNAQLELLAKDSLAVPAAAVSAAADLTAIGSAPGASVAGALEAGNEFNADRKAEYQKAVAHIESYQRLVRTLGYVRDGISQGSILILMALGLAITFGVMGVINMAHGELMMIGAIATYAMQQYFINHMPESMFNWYFVVSLPVAFLSAAIAGYLIELLVVRFLYGRALDTLLATWGVSLILIQGVRVIYGNLIGVRAPTWLQGRSFEVIQDLVLPYNRCFIVILCIVCVALIYGLLNYTKLGLRIRATMQNREMAAALGVSTRRVDGYTFALGAGIAGIAGYALTLIGGVTPDMGQNYIVESFLVVVTGGVGELAGTIYAGLGLGMIDKFLEPWTAAVWGQVIVLVLVVLFIQRRPSGLFPPKGRLADV